MTGFIHASVGGFIGKVLPLPIALPVVFASHFVLDALPHYGIPHGKRDGWFWKCFTTLDFILSWGYLGVIGLLRHHYAVLACGIAAASPDFIWVARIIRNRTFDLSDHENKFASRFTRWHAGIQRYERAWGVYLEVPIAVVMGFLVFKYW